MDEQQIYLNNCENENPEEIKIKLG